MKNQIFIPVPEPLRAAFLPAAQLKHRALGCSGRSSPDPVMHLYFCTGYPQPQVVAPDLPGVATQMIMLWR
jgi:hypothetical protein